MNPGEYRNSIPEGLRVIRVGTHAISAGSKSKLWKRLQQHRGTKHGTGNHRGSIFRLHVGSALINRSDRQLDAPTWGIRGSAGKATRDLERPLEKEVSTYLGRLNLLWLDVDDEPSKESDRALLERNAIGLLSTVGRDADPPSKEWLGHWSNSQAIRSSGLWNVNHVGEEYDSSFLDVMASYVERAMKGSR